jgi:hypothetical protein
MKAQWMLSNRGGGCKTKRFFFTYCSCPKENLVSFKELADRCDRCKRQAVDQCYHHDVCYSITTEKFLEELDVVLGCYHERHGKSYAEVRLESKLKMDHMQVNKSSDVKHVDFSIEHGSPEQVRQYAHFILRECMIRGIPVTGTVTDWQAALKCCFLLEKSLDMLDLVKQLHESGRLNVPLVKVLEILIPCILHLENWANEKIITSIL